MGPPPGLERRQRQIHGSVGSAGDSIGISAPRRRNNLALEFRDRPVVAGRFSNEVNIWGRDRLADLLRGDRALLCGGGEGAGGRRPRGSRFAAVLTFSDAAPAVDLR